MEILTRQNKLGSIADFKSGNFEDKKFIFTLLNANSSNSYYDKATNLRAKNFPTKYLMLLFAQVRLKGKGNRIARYIPGELSIWKDEQTPDDKVPKSNNYLEFVNGRKIIDGSEKQLIEMLMIMDINESKHDRDKSVTPVFRLLDMGVGLEKEIKKETEVAELNLWCLSGNWDEVSAYARVLGVDLNRDPAEIRYEMKRRAMNNPALFKEGMNNPLTKRKHFIYEAIDAGILVVDRDINSISWNDGKLIITANRAMDIVDFLTDYTQTEEGELFYEKLLSKLGKKSDKKEVVQEPEITTTGLTVDEAKSLFEKAVAEEVIVKNGRSAWCFDKNGAHELNRVGDAAMIKAFLDNKDFVKAVKSKLKI